MCVSQYLSRNATTPGIRDYASQPHPNDAALRQTMPGIIDPLLAVQGKSFALKLGVQLNT
jgi:hypothetical protein